MTASHLTQFEAELLAASEAGVSLVEWRDRQAALPQLERDARVLEKEEQQACYKLFRAHGCTVRNLSQSRASRQAPGLPDAFVVHRGIRRAWWWETKRQVGGRLSPAQQEFRDDCAWCFTPWHTGDRHAARRLLRELGLIDEQGEPLHPSRPA